MEEYVMCRTVGHSWDHIPNTRRPPWGTLLTFRCTRCGTTREDIIDNLGDLSHRRYVRPSDYKTMTPRKRADWRLLLVWQSRKSRR